MNNQNLKTNFPQHIPLSSRDWRPGEEALTSSALSVSMGLACTAEQMECGEVDHIQAQLDERLQAPPREFSP